LTVYLLVWHCTRARFTILVSCCDERAVHSCRFFRAEAGCEPAKRIVLWFVFIA